MIVLPCLPSMIKTNVYHLYWWQGNHTMFTALSALTECMILYCILLTWRTWIQKGYAFVRWALSRGISSFNGEQQYLVWVSESASRHDSLVGDKSSPLSSCGSNKSLPRLCVIAIKPSTCQNSTTVCSLPLEFGNWTGLCQSVIHFRVGSWWLFH